MSAWAELFPDEDHRFHLALRRVGLREFFAATPDGPRLLAERRHWLEEAPGCHAALLPEGRALVATLAAALELEPGQTVAQLGLRLEPDFLLLAPGEDGRHRLLGGALCFPTGWSLTASLGRPLEAIHGVVPGLNASLASPIQRMLSQLKPGAGVGRANWGLAATPALNLHPDQPRPRLGEPLDLAQVWLRIEHQVLAALDTAGGVVFGIRVTCVPWAEVCADEAVRRGLHRALRTMPEPVLAYKGLLAVCPSLLRALEA